MDTKKITYTVSWTQRPEHWNIPNAIKILETARKKALELEQKNLEELSIRETNSLIERLTCKKKIQPNGS